MFDVPALIGIRAYEMAGADGGADAPRAFRIVEWITRTDLDFERDKSLLDVASNVFSCEPLKV